MNKKVVISAVVILSIAIGGFLFIKNSSSQPTLSTEIQIIPSSATNNGQK